MNNAEPQYRPAAHVHSKQIQGEEVLLDTETGFYFGLDETGSFVWQRLLLGKDVESIIEELCQSYDVARPVAKKDILGLIASLIEANLVTPYLTGQNE